MTLQEWIQLSETRMNKIALLKLMMQNLFFYGEDRIHTQNVSEQVNLTQLSFSGI